MKAIQFLILCFLFITTTGAAQKRQLDSLLTELNEHSKKNVEYLNILNQLTQVYANMQIDSGLVTADKAILLAEKLNEPVLLANAYNNKAYLLSRIGKKNEASNYIQKAMLLYKSRQNQNGIGDCYMNSALAIASQGYRSLEFSYSDSAIYMYKKTNNLDGLAKAILNKAYLYRDENNTLASAQFKEALKIYEKTGNLSGQATALLGFAATLRNSGNNKDYLTSLDNGRKIAESIQDYYVMFIAYGNYYIYYSYTSNNSLAAKYIFKSIKMCELMGDKINGSWNYIMLADLYCNSGNYNEAIKYGLESEALGRKLNDPSIIALSLNYLGLSYLKKNENEKALIAYKEMLIINQSLKSEADIALSYCSIARCYSQMGDYKSALINYHRGLPIFVSMNEKHDYADALIGYSKTIYKANEKDLSEAGITTPSRLKLVIQNLERAYQISIEGQYGSLRRDALLELSEFYEKEGDAIKSLGHYRQYVAIKDSIMNTENSNSLANLQLQYESEKQEQQIQLLSKDKAIQSTEIRRQKTTSNAFLGGFVLVLMLAGVTYNRYLIKRRANTQLIHTLAELKNTQAQLVKSEKMAAFGVLASRVAHEIQNPLNFVNNFSEFSEELLQEIVVSNNAQERKEIAKSFSENLLKINHHGKRAEIIVKQLQEHIRAGTAHEYFEENKS